MGFEKPEKKKTKIIHLSDVIRAGAEAVLDGALKSIQLDKSTAPYPHQAMPPENESAPSSHLSQENIQRTIAKVGQPRENDKMG
jgi:hypothetical protein